VDQTDNQRSRCSLALSPDRSSHSIHVPTEPSDHIDVGVFAIPTNVVGVRGSALFKDSQKRFAVIDDLQPVPDVPAFAVHRQRLLFHDV